MTENPLDQSTLVLNWTKGPQQGRSLNILKKKCLLKWRSAQPQTTGEPPVPALAILQGPEGVALRAFGDAIMLNGITAESHWLRHGDRLVHDRFEAQIEFRQEDSFSLSHSAPGMHGGRQPWDRLHELLEQMGNNREHSNRMTRKIKSLAKQTRQIAKHCQRLDSQLSESSGQSLQAINEKLDAVWDKLSQLADRPATSFPTAPTNFAVATPDCAPAAVIVDSEWKLTDAARSIESSLNSESNNHFASANENPVVESPWQASDSPFANLTQDWQVEELTWNTQADEPATPTNPSQSDCWNIETSSVVEAFAPSRPIFEMNAPSMESEDSMVSEEEVQGVTVAEPEVETAPSVADMWNSQEQQFAELEQHLVAEVQQQWSTDGNAAPVDSPATETAASPIATMADVFGDLENAHGSLTVNPPLSVEPAANSEVDLESILKRLRQIETNFQQEQDRSSTMCLNESGIVDLLNPSVSDVASPLPESNSFAPPAAESLEIPASAQDSSVFGGTRVVDTNDSQSSLAWLTDAAVTEKPAVDAEQKIEMLSQLYDSAIQGNLENDAWSQLMQPSPTPASEISMPVASEPAPTSAASELSDFFASLTSPQPQNPPESSSEILASELRFDSSEVDPAVGVGEISNESNRSELSRLRADLASLFETPELPARDEQVAIESESAAFGSDLQSNWNPSDVDSTIDRNEAFEIPTGGVITASDAGLQPETSSETSFVLPENVAETVEPEVAAAVPPVPTYVPPAGAEHDDGVTNYMNQLFQRLRVNPASAGASPAPVKPQTPAAPVTPSTETEAAQPAVEPVVNNRVEFMAPDEFKPKQQAPERHTDMNALRNLANASVRSALDEFAEKQKHGLAALRYATAGGGLAFSVVLFAASNAIGDIWFLGGCGCIFAAAASFLWHYHVAMQEAKKELISSGELDEQNAQTRLEARLAVSVQEPAVAENRAENNEAKP